MEKQHDQLSMMLGLGHRDSTDLILDNYLPTFAALGNTSVFDPQ